MKKRYAVMALGFVAVTAAHAATHTVNSTADSGTGSLRDIVAAATTGDTITFDQALSGQSIVLTGSSIAVDKSLYIIGLPGQQVTIDGGGNNRIFVNTAGSPGLFVEDLILTNAVSSGGGGAIHNTAHLTVDKCLFTGDTTNTTSNIQGGGAIHSYGAGAMLTVRNSTFESCQATNTSSYGGGAIYLGSNLSGNTQYLIENSLFKDNATGINGGALSLFYADGAVYNCTFTGNTAGYSGGAIAQQWNGQSYFYNCTVVNNTANRPSITGGGGIYAQSGGNLTLGYSIVANNTAASGVGHDVNSTSSYITSAGYNIIESTGNTGISFPGNEISGVDPELNALADNGGPTMTFAPKCGSPAINGGNMPNMPYTTDARGLPRFVEDSLDIGAYETQAPQPDLDDAVVCDDEHVVLEVFTSDSINWYDGSDNLLDANVTIYNTSNLNSFPATLIVEAYGDNGCKFGRDTITVTSSSSPVVDESVPAQACTGTGFNVSASVKKNVTYSWDFGNDDTIDTTSLSAEFTPNLAGDLEILVLAENAFGCIGEKVVTVDVIQTPGAFFTTDMVCFGDTTSYTNQSEGLSNATFAWDFFGQDAVDDTAANPKVVMPTTAGYSSTLTVTNEGLCSNEYTAGVLTFMVPTADFSAPDACQGEPVQFSNETTSQNNATLAWDFESDMSTDSDDDNPLVTFDTAGAYQVQLIVNNVGNCPDTVYHTIEIKPAPEADFEIDGLCHELGGAVINNSSEVDVTYEWDFNQDNQTDTTGAIDSIMYGGLGDMTIKLTVTSINGCVNSAENTITVKGAPTADFDWEPVCEGFVLSLYDESIAAVDYQWDLDDDGETDSQIASSISHNFGDAGDYLVELKVSNECGTDSIDRMVTILAPVVPVITDSVGILVSTAAIDYQWSLNGQVIDLADQRSHAPDANGDYTVETTDENGCIATSEALNITGVGLAYQTLISMAVYPNPSVNVVNVSGLIPGSIVLLSNNLGQVVYEAVAHNSLHQIWTNELPAGQYQMTVLSSDTQILANNTVVITNR